MLFLTNTFPMATTPVHMVPVSADVVKAECIKGYFSLINDATLATVLSNLLGIQIPVATQGGINPRVGEDSVIIVQSSVQLPTGTSLLPQGVAINFAMIRAEQPQPQFGAIQVAQVTQQGIGLLRKVAKWLY
jgi:hypothetical protein